MERKPLSFAITIAVSGGSGSNTTPLNSAIYNAGGYLRQMIVNAPEATATFDFRIANANGHNVYKRTQIPDGELIEDMQTPMPSGRYTLYLSNCSHDGSYECELVFAEVY
jgi:hypothetical protein